MKIAVVCGTFREDWGYQENFWAEELSLAGHSVRVFTAGSRNSSPMMSLVDDPKYELCRLPTRWLPHKVLLSSGLQTAIADFGPDLILWFGVEQFFGRALASRRPVSKAPIVSFFGVNRGMHEFDWRRPGIAVKQRLHAVVWRLLRGGLIRKACFQSRLIVVTVPETRQLLHLLWSSKGASSVDERILHIPLGFSPRTYGWNSTTRRRTRWQLGISSESVVVCFSCRFSAPAKEKRNARTLKGIHAALKKCEWLHGVFVGFEQDGISMRLKGILLDGGLGDRVHCLPFADQHRLNELYNAADLGIFPNPSISCQAALGTGLTVGLANNGTMDHLIRESSQAFFFDPHSEAELACRIVELAGSLRTSSEEPRHTRRAALANASRWLGYDRLAAFLLESVGSPDTRRPAPAQACQT